MDEAGQPFLYGEDGEPFIGDRDILERPDLFYSAGPDAQQPFGISRVGREDRRRR